MNTTGTDLPAGTGDALHILEPGGAGWWTLLAVLLVPFLMGLVMQWLKGLPAQGGRPTPRARMKPPPVPSNNLTLAIDALRDETLADADYRAGCHRLGSLMRDHARRQWPLLSSWTVPEIIARIGDTPYSTVLALLADLQFRRAEPDEGEFLDICQLARDTASGTTGSSPGTESTSETGSTSGRSS